jgi:hypothetical protein
MDATVADQYITYPTDSKILNCSRKQCEKMIDQRYELNDKRALNHVLIAAKWIRPFWIIPRRKTNQSVFTEK